MASDQIDDGHSAPAELALDRVAVRKSHPEQSAGIGQGPPPEGNASR
jgi:hypothetical protein